MSVQLPSAARTHSHSHFRLFSPSLLFLLPLPPQGLTTVSSLSRFAPALIPLLRVEVVRAIVEGILPGLVLIIFYALLPPLVRALSAKEGIDRESRLDVAQMRKLYLFGVVNIFFGNVIAGARCECAGWPHPQRALALAGGMAPLRK